MSGGMTLSKLAEVAKKSPTSSRDAGTSYSASNLKSVIAVSFERLIIVCALGFYGASHLSVSVLSGKRTACKRKSLDPCFAVERIVGRETVHAY